MAVVETLFGESLHPGTISSIATKTNFDYF